MATKEKFEEAKRLYETANADQRYVLESLFPELAESEDERIRKMLIEFFSKGAEYNSSTNGISDKDIVAWLEKQAQEPVYKVEPKFKVGDWLQYRNAKPFFVEEITKQGYVNGDSCLPFNWENEIHLWTIQDAKDGDVLATSAGVFIYNGNNGGGSCSGSYCGIDTLGGFKTGVEHHWTGKPVFPSTKEQRDLLFQKMHKAGYEWDAEKKELKKIEDEPTDVVEPKFHEGDIIIHKELGGDYIHNPHKIIQVDILDKKYRLEGGLVAHFGEQEDYELVERKPAWSEEDESWFKELELMALSFSNDDSYRKKFFDWLKFLKERVQPKQKWSEDDEKVLHAIKNALNYEKPRNYLKSRDFEFTDILDWLKSLKDRVQPQPHWKPSDEQLYWIKWVAHRLPDTEKANEAEAVLEELLEELNKL